MAEGRSRPLPFGTEEWPTSLDETRSELMDMGHRRSGEIPPAVLVEQTLVATEGRDWPLRKAAFEALLRRSKFAARDGLAVLRRPPGRRGPVGTAADRWPSASGFEASSSRNLRVHAPRKR